VGGPRAEVGLTRRKGPALGVGKWNSPKRRLVPSATWTTVGAGVACRVVQYWPSCGGSSTACRQQSSPHRRFVSVSCLRLRAWPVSRRSSAMTWNATRRHGGFGFWPCGPAGRRTTVGWRVRRCAVWLTSPCIWIGRMRHLGWSGWRTRWRPAVVTVGYGWRWLKRPPTRSGATPWRVTRRRVVVRSDSRRPVRKGRRR